MNSKLRLFEFLAAWNIVVWTKWMENGGILMANYTPPASNKELIQSKLRWDCVKKLDGKIFWYFITLNKLEHMDGSTRKKSLLNKDRKKKTHLIKHWHLAFSHVKQYKEAKKPRLFFKEFLTEKADGNRISHRCILWESRSNLRHGFWSKWQKGLQNRVKINHYFGVEVVKVEIRFFHYFR